MAGKGNDGRPIIIVKRYRKGENRYHGGAWKVAYADFVTAMMAFFLVMWLVTAVSKEERAAIFDYFKNPSMEPGKSVKPSPGQMGPGGASTSPINLGGGLDAARTSVSPMPGIGTPVQSPVSTPASKITELTPQQKAAAQAKALQMAAEQLQAAKERKQLEALMQDLKEAIDRSQALEPFKDQLLLDIAPEGLRIQIVDAQNRPMFDLGSSRLKSYTNTILRELTPYLNSVPNRLSLTGHTDITAYTGLTGYTNWDLSTDRANAARRALEGAGLAANKVARVVGLSSSVLFDKANPRNPVNRRISIIVMTSEAEQDAIKTEVPTLAAAGTTDAPPAAALAVGSQASASAEVAALPGIAAPAQ